MSRSLRQWATQPAWAQAPNPALKLSTLLSPVLGGGGYYGGGANGSRYAYRRVLGPEWTIGGEYVARGAALFGSAVVLPSGTVGTIGRANPNSAALSIGFVFVPYTVATGAVGLWSIADTDTSGYPRVLLQRNGADVRLYFGSGGYVITFSGVLAANKPCTIAISFSTIASGAACLVRMAVNGVVKEYSGTHSTNAATNEYLMSGYNGSATGAYGEFWETQQELPSKKLISLSLNPWQIYAPITRRRSSPTASGNPTVALTGNAATAAQGTVTPGIILTLTGNGDTASVGAVTAALSLALSGNAATGAAGATVADLSLPLTGNGATASAGTVSVGSTFEAALSGSSATAEAGNVSPALSLALSGNSASASAGIVEVAGVFGAALSGSALASAAGSLTPSVSVAVAGASATASQGDVGKGIGKSITGNSAASASGSVSASLSIAISGNAATATHGDVVPSGPIVVGLTGNGSVASAGILAVFGTIPFLPQTGIDTIVESYTKDLVYQAATKPRVFIARHHR